MDIENNGSAKFSFEEISEADRRLLYEIIEDVVTEILAAAGITGD